MPNETGVIWVRVSTEQQSHGYSQDAQLKAVSEAAKARGIEITRKFIIAESAKDSANRKQFRKMIEYVLETNATYIVFTDVDRITRNTKDLVQIQDLIINKGKKILISSQNKVIEKNSKPGDKFLFNMQSIVAEYDNGLRAEKTLAGMEEKVRNGGVPGMVPIGYLNVADKNDPLLRRRTVIVDPDRAPSVKDAFLLYAGGKYSIDSLRLEMTRRGLRTKQTAARPNSPISKHCLEKILKNRFYIGEFKWNKQLWKGEYELFISRELFNRVQKVLRDKFRGSQASGRRNFAFKPFLRCGYCKTHFTGELQKEHFVYYRCTFSKGRCDQPYFPEEKIDKILSAAIGNLYIDESLAVGVRKHIIGFKNQDELKLSTRLANLLQKKDRLSLLLRKAWESLAEELISRDEYKKYRNDYQSEIAGIEAETERLSKRNLVFKDEGIIVLDIIKGLKDTYSKQDPKGKAQILNIILDQVIMKGDEAQFCWRPPFDTLFDMGELASKGELVIRKSKWGG